MTSGTSGLVPSGGTNAKFLRGDATWQTPTNTTYGAMTSGTSGLVPAGGTNTKFLRGDATWQTPTNTTYAAMTSGTSGLVPSGGTSATYLKGDGTWGTPAGSTYGAMTSAIGIAGTDTDNRVISALVLKQIIDNRFWEGNQAAYDAITTKNPETLYFIRPT